MKRFRTILSLLIILLTGTLALSSCDVYLPDNPYNPYYPNNGEGDRSRAYTISGEWQGNFGMYYLQQNPLTGEYVQFNAATSYVLFQSDYYGARTGWGKQIDYYNYGPIAYRYHRFYWEVRNGVLYLTYPSDHNLDVAIYDYYLSQYRFTGRTGTSGFTFNLRSLSFNEWGSFTGDAYDRTSSTWNWDGYIGTRSVTMQKADSPTPTENKILSGRK